MDVELWIVFFRWLLLKACLIGLAAILPAFLFLKIFERVEASRKSVKRYGWCFSLLFMICSAWATYTSLPSSEEKLEYLRSKEEQEAVNKAWGSILFPSDQTVGSGGSSSASGKDNAASETAASTGEEDTSTERGDDNAENAEIINLDGRTLASEDFARGFVLTGIGTDEMHDFSAPTNAVVCEDWLADGAARDWFYAAFNDWSFRFGTNDVEWLRIFSDGELNPFPSPEGTFFAPFKTSLGIAPEVNWERLADTDRPSCFWHAHTPSNTLVLTWQNALFSRETNAPASFQMEIWRSGNFAYRYDLSRTGLWNGVFPSNIVVGAGLGGVSGLVDLSALTNLTSLYFHRLDPADMPGSDRDGDGLSIENEIFIYGTDPDFRDSDFDGLPDGEETAKGSNPRLRDSDGDGMVDGSDPDPLGATSANDQDGDGIPDAYEVYWFGDTNVAASAAFRDDTGFDLSGKMLAGLNPTNAACSAYEAIPGSLVSWQLFDGFSADWSAVPTNLVWERTFFIGRSNPWQQFFISAAPTNAAEWKLSGMVLEWETDEGLAGTLESSPRGDSFRIPFATNDCPYSLTIRLRATESIVSASVPLHLIAYAPEYRIDGGSEITGKSGMKFRVYMDGSDSQVSFKIDRSRRPCNTPALADELDMAWFHEMMGYDEYVDYQGDATGGKLAVGRPGEYYLPDPSLGVSSAAMFRRPRSGGGGGIVIVLDPSASWACDGHGYGYDGLGYGWAGEGYYEEDVYPLDSGCLRRKWYHGWDGEWIHDNCELRVTGGVGDGSAYVTTEVDDETGKVYVDGVEVWSGSAEHTYDDTGDSGSGEDVLGDGCNSCETDCANGNCDSLEGASLGSLKFRIPLGNPVKGQVAGFVWFASDWPVYVSTDIFELKKHPSASITDTVSSGVRRIVCADSRGRDLRIEEIDEGVRIEICETHTGKLEHTWEITNIDWNPEVVHLKKISRLDNVMSDETFTYQDGDWIRFDNIAGVGTRLYVYDDFADYGDGVKREIRETTDANGAWISYVTTDSARVGECENAVMREILREEWTGCNTVSSYADYWNDPSHFARHGKPRLVWGNSRAWVYMDYDEKGHETLRVEQRGESEMPWENFPYVVSNVLHNASTLENAFVTVKDYAPFEGDACHQDDAAKPRQETRYVVVDGTAKVIGRTWWRYVRISRNGYDAIRKETWRAFAPGASREDASNAYSHEIVYSSTGDNTPLLMRDAVAESLDEDGVLTRNTYSLAGGIFRQVSRRSFDGNDHPTYTVTEQDATYGNVLRRSERLTANDALIADERSTYDEKNRLRSTSYLDGTSVTNAYSCCRLLWRRDREGRKTLRSAKTGTDHLYNAEEDVWLADISTNGQYRVTQHFFDSLGRETNTVVCIGTVPGEAVESDFNRVEHVERVERKTEYPYGGSDYAVTTDERGKVTVTRKDIIANAQESGETVFTNGIEVVKTKSRTYFGGGSSMRREWPVGRVDPSVPGGSPSSATAWTEERRFTEYAHDGKRIDYVVTESSDNGVVTNSVSTYDLLGRLVTQKTALGVTVCSYDDASSRMTGQTFVSGDVMRESSFLYNDYGEQVGVLQDGVTTRADVAYETDSSNIVWRVTTERTFGASTNACAVTRERLTGLSDGCRSCVVKTDLSGAWMRNEKSFDPDSKIETETTQSSSSMPIVRKSHCGVLLSTETSGSVVSNGYDALARVAFSMRKIGEGAFMPYQRFGYAPSGDLLVMDTYTNATDVVSEFYAYDMIGNRIATTDALGNTVYKSFDPFGNLLWEWGAIYPVRYAYDTQNRRTSLSTTRDGDTWDETRWIYDAATGLCTSKIYADESTVVYTYTPDGLLLRETKSEGTWKEYIYNAKRQIIGFVSSDGKQDAIIERDEFGRVVSESNIAASSLHFLHDQFGATNQMDNIDGVSASFVREFDQNGRLVRFGRVGGETAQYVYATHDSISEVLNSEVAVHYSYSDDLLNAGYRIAIQDGSDFIRENYRDVYCRDNILAITNRHGGTIRGINYLYDALQRPVLRNDDEFSYNELGEIVFYRRDAENTENTYFYDGIGNLNLYEIVGVGTNSFSVNNRNQYLAILENSASSASLRETNLKYDSNGNLTKFGDWSYVYDSGNRLVSVSSNNTVVATFAYDTQGRRVKKVAADGTHHYFYDGQLLVYEHITRPDNTVSEIDYVWGNDISGARDSACGIGGLLYLKRNGSIYIPFFDAYGNVLGYIDAQGNVVAEYTYDPFGKIVGKSGAMSDDFAFRFSTKYYDIELDLYYYTYRYYNPQLMRWLTEDPIAEDGGLNLYGFCGNNPVCRYDKDGRAYFAKRALAGQSWSEKFSINAKLDAAEWEWSHEHLFYGTPDNPLDDVGYFGDGKVRSDEARAKSKYIVTSSGYNDCVMKKAQEQVAPKRYCVFLGALPWFDNCQSYAAKLRAKYDELLYDEKVLCECFGKRKIGGAIWLK